jgi:uncharacterized protein with ParB-like and HNH nuclease domain
MGQFQVPFSISQIINKIDLNLLLLPAIQREFVWEHTQIELLFDSLMRGYPIGSLLFWRVMGENKTSHRYYSVLKKFRAKYDTHCQEFNTNQHNDFEAILDGQQRLTALYVGLKGTYAYKKPRVSWKNNEHSLPTRKLFLNIKELAPQDETSGEVSEDGRVYDFQFLSEEDLEKCNRTDWFEVGKILDLQSFSSLKNYLKDTGLDENDFAMDTLEKLHASIFENRINYYLEDSQDYNKALNIFIRVNSGGEKLSYSDLIMSTTIAGWKKKDARQEFNNLINEVWSQYGFNIDKDFVLRTYLMLFCNDIKFRVTNFSIDNAIEFEENWDHIRESIITAFHLINDFGYVEDTLTSKNAVLPIAYYIYKSEKDLTYCDKVPYKEDRSEIKKWVHAVLLHRIFGGQAESLLKIIRDTLESELKGNSEKFPAKQIAQRLSKTRKSITVDDEFIENLLYTRYRDRYSFPILALLYPHLDYKNRDFHKDHVHPYSVFTKTKLKKYGITPKGDEDCYYSDKNMYDSVINLQMLDSNMNKSKNDMMLEDWVKQEKVDLQKQLIPNILNIKDFEKYAEARFELLKQRLTELLTY